MSIIQKFFTLPPFLFRKITKPDSVINEVAPNLFQNLKDSSKEFIKAVLNKDGDFIRQISARSLGDHIVQDLQQYQNSDLVQKFNLSKYNFESNMNFEICPYVIFGEDFKTRIQSSNLWESMRPISSNRFIKWDPKLSMMEKFNSYRKKQIFGFNCIYEPAIVDVAESDVRKLIKPLMITIETDSENIDPFIVDCQGFMLQKWRSGNKA